MIHKFPAMSGLLVYFLEPHLRRCLLTLWREEGRGRKWKRGKGRGLERDRRERNINWVPPIISPAGDGICNRVLCSDQQLNPQPFGQPDGKPPARAGSLPSTSLQQRTAYRPTDPSREPQWAPTQTLAPTPYSQCKSATEGSALDENWQALPRPLTVLQHNRKWVLDSNY